MAASMAVFTVGLLFALFLVASARQLVQDPIQTDHTSTEFKGKSEVSKDFVLGYGGLGYGGLGYGGYGGYGPGYGGFASERNSQVVNPEQYRGNLGYGGYGGYGGYYPPASEIRKSLVYYGPGGYGWYGPGGYGGLPAAEKKAQQITNDNYPQGGGR